MIEQVSMICLYLICVTTGLVGGISSFFYSRNEDDGISIIQLISISFFAFTITIILGDTIFELSFKTIAIYSYLIFTLSVLSLYKRKISSKMLLSLIIMLVFVVLAIPLSTISDNLKLDQDSYFNIINILAIIPIVLSLVILNKFKNDKLPSKYNNIISIMLIGVVTIVISPVEYAAILTTVILFFPAVFILALMKIEEDKSVNKIKSKLNTLQSEFNYELRKELNKRTFHLKEVQEKMSHINKIDGLTGAYNKKAIFNIIDDMLEDRKVSNFTLIMFDLDNFKTLNDTFGHVQGDLCLKTLASIAFESVRDSDYFGRYGGDEFLIALPNASLQTALTISERFRKTVAVKTKPPFTVSIGLASYPTDGKTIKELLDVADKGLYYSKEKGRNSVSYHNPDLDKKF